MTDIVKGMVKASYDLPPYFGQELTAEKAMRAALLWLADNVSDEMVLGSILLPNDPKEVPLRLAFKSPKHKDTIERTRASISRAIRAAAGGGEDPLPHLNDAQKALFVSALLGKHQPGDAGPTTPPKDGD